MKRSVFMLLLALSLHHVSGKEPMKTDTVSFVFEGKKLTGLLDLPGNKKPEALILLIPGSGSTNMVDGNGYYKRLRSFFTDEGFACYVWDKSGCGKSEGVFNGDNSIQNSAQEAIVAIEELKRLNIPGSDKVGLWGLSRGGWVCPLIIADYPSIAFWISVSGPDGEDNFGYLLERNFLIEGRSKEETQLLMKAWYSNTDIARHGGTFEENQKAIEPLRNDSFYTFITKGDSKPTKEKYIKWQKSFRDGTNPYPVNEQTGLQVYFPDFDKVLGKLNCPVLAISGEKDSQVDWQKTIALYQKSIGKTTPATLTVKTFPDGNHNLFKCKTGGFREKLDKIEFCEGYFDTMSAWLKGLLIIEGNSKLPTLKDGQTD
jgi:pimeloyl-ACP methyl ester carboxylesterase